MELDLDFWTRRRVLVTGHTGFKGAWLALWLQSLGAAVTGIARGAPPTPSLYELADVGAHMQALSVDVCDASAVCEALRQVRPEVVLHLAAQPLVGRSLVLPAETYEVNVMGTLNVLDAVRQVPGDVRAVVIVTSDTCYRSREERSRRFVEEDPLGGRDPYSSSKACAELLVSAYRRSFFSGEGSPRLATARAGNVVGGGDWGEDRLVPDAVRAVETGSPLKLRSPQAVRPWQHVLSPLSGYLRLAQALCDERGSQAARAWNFGPREHDARPVSWVVERLAQLWAGELTWEADERTNAPQSSRLALDSSAAERALGWRPACELEQALELTVRWHRAHRGGQDMRRVSLAQIACLG